MSITSLASPWRGWKFAESSFLLWRDDCAQSSLHVTLPTLQVNLWTYFRTLCKAMMKLSYYLVTSAYWSATDNRLVSIPEQCARHWGTRENHATACGDSMDPTDIADFEVHNSDLRRAAVLNWWFRSQQKVWSPTFCWGMGGKGSLNLVSVNCVNFWEDMRRRPCSDGSL